MAFQIATKQVSAAKVGAFGLMGTGKTTLLTMLAIYLSKTYHNSAPVAFQDTEKGVDFVKPYFDMEGVPLLSEKTRAFIDLRDAGRRAKEAGACVLIDDSLTHFWQELLRIVKGDAERLDIKKIGEAKERWGEFTSNYDRQNIHWLVAGRLGYDWENVDVEDEKSGQIKNELLRGGTKMKAEGDFSYEPDLVLELTSADDPDAADYRRLKRGKRIMKLASGQIHIALVKKCRVRALNGQMFSWPDKATYKLGDYVKVAECFKPYFDFLNIGGEHVAFDVTRNSSAIIDTSNRNDFYEKKRRREIALEDIEGCLRSVWSAATGKDAQAKGEVFNALFGTYSWTAVQALPPEVLENAATICVRMKALALQKMPADRAELLALVQQAANLQESVPSGSQPQQAEIPYPEHIGVTTSPVAAAPEQSAFTLPPEKKTRRPKRDGVAKTDGTKETSVPTDSKEAPAVTSAAAGSNPAPSLPVNAHGVAITDDDLPAGLGDNPLPTAKEKKAYAERLRSYNLPPEKLKEIVLGWTGKPDTNSISKELWERLLKELDTASECPGGITAWWASGRKADQEEPF
jgi:hypothetical protein